MSAFLYLNQPRQIASANYITMINPTLHPDRIMPEHDLLYMLDGTWEIAEEQEDGHGRSIWQMQTNDLLLLPAGRHHYGTSLCSPNNRHMYIHVTPLFKELEMNRTIPFPQEASSSHPCPAPDSSKHPHTFHSLIHCQNNPDIRKIFEEIISKSWEQSSFQDDKLSLLLNLLFCELLEQQEKPVQTGSYKNIAAEAARLIQTTPQTFFTGKDLADHFYVCERTLTNQFKKNYGKTLYAYQMDVKLEMVREFLITQPNVKLHETALNFGFCDEFHLSRTFRKKYGISPSQYRTQNLV